MALHKPKSKQALSAPIEREIKFSIDWRTAKRLRHDPAVSAVEPAIFDQISEYWDTDRRDLRAAGVSLRLRHFADRTVQTIKAEGDANAGVVGRIEDEFSIEGDEPDIAALERHASPELMTAITGQLRPQFRIVVQRTQWRIERDRARFNIDLDEGDIEAGRRMRRIRELEVELVEGPVQALFALARELALRLPIRMQFCTKSDRGFSLLDGDDCRNRKTAPRPLDPELTRADAFRTLAMTAIRAFVLHAGTFTPKSQAETIHAMRVAIRRLRSLLRFDRDLFTNAEAETLRGEIGWVFDQLGAARNLDIIIAEMGTWPADAVPEGALDRLHTERATAYGEVAAMLGSARHRLGVVDLVAMVECGSWTARSVGSPAREGTGLVLRRAWKAVSQTDPPSELSPERRHRLRIHAKRLRYACDFYAGLYPAPRAAERCARMIEAATALQDALGLLTDRMTIDALIAEHFPGSQRPVAAGIDDAALLRAADKAHRRLAACKPFWK
jgi:inorganic triphosphatase YgiF